MKRLIEGTIYSPTVKKPNQWGKYSVHIDGAFHDTEDPFEGYASNQNQIPFFKDGESDPIEDISFLEGKEFEGYVMVSEYENSHGTFFSALGVVVKDVIGEYTGNTCKTNPLL